MRVLYEFFWFVVTSVALALVAVSIGVLLSGCAGVQHQERRPTLADTKGHAPQPIATPVLDVAPIPTPQQVAWTPLPASVQEPERQPRPRKPAPVMSAGGRIITYEPGKKYPLYCPEFGALSVLLPMGETIQALVSGNSGEWMIERTTTGIELPIPVVAIRRAPYAATSELHVITDAAIYQFILIPQFKAVSNGQQSLVVMVNTDTEARRAEREAMELAKEERRRRAAAERAQIPFDYVRAYQNGIEGAR